MDAIFNRSSVRRFLDKAVDDVQVVQLLKAAMCAPSAGNEQPWHFVVVKNRETLDAVTQFHPYTQMLKEAPLAIVACADIRDVKYGGDFWIQDMSAAVQNILLEAVTLGLGTCWCGLYPKTALVDPMKKLIALPEGIEPVAIIAVGYALEAKEAPERFKADRIHYETF